MENDPSSPHLDSMRSQLESLQKRIQALESENAKLSTRLSNCVCQKIAESDNTHVLDSRHSIEDVERLKVDNNDVNYRLKEAVQDACCSSRSMHHLPKRYVALKVMYFGQRFYGFASEAQLDPTVESEILKALRKTRLIYGDKKELHYSRCGRTDKGVSSVGQVISLFLRSNLKAIVGGSGCSGESFAKDSCEGEIDYVNNLNRVLPKDIRIIGWSPAPTDFSARFSCLSREYKYFFWGANLNIMAMETAGGISHRLRFLLVMKGLNIEFDAVRVQILGKEELPSLNEAIAIVRAEEGRRGVMIEHNTVYNSALAATKGRNFGTEQLVG